LVWVVFITNSSRCSIPTVELSGLKNRSECGRKE
jgi:hypothetical protein